MAGKKKEFDGEGTGETKQRKRGAETVAKMLRKRVTEVNDLISELRADGLEVQANFDAADMVLSIEEIKFVKTL